MWRGIIVKLRAQTAWMREATLGVQPKHPP
jgi:hypothetical protein